MSKKVAIITGAGQGIGKAIARRLAKDGMNIAIADINLETAQAAADEIAKEFGGEAMAIKCNVSQEEEINAAVQAVLDRFGTIDVLVNNAGVNKIVCSYDLDMADFRVWLGHKELLGDEEEQLCVRVMDHCLERLMAEGQGEVAAALLSGDEKTFVAFRAEAPELKHLPVATYQWFCKNYLDRYYPVRFMIRANGVTL